MTQGERNQRLIDEITTNGKPDRDKMQAVLLEQFIAELLLRRPGSSPDEVTRAFAEKYEGQLSWLGEARQDEILKAAQISTGIDLSHWLNKGEAG